MNFISPKIRVRFAPSPTGIMHLGNVRAALLNFLFAKQKDGTFVLRIEDTDEQRNLKSAVKQILDDLAWLKLDYQEGPYFQSDNLSLYQEYLDKLIDTNLVYKCFCTPEALAIKKERQMSLRQAPRYDKACLKLSLEDVLENTNQNIPFVWRFKVPKGDLAFFDLAKGEMKFELNNFADFSLTRSDGSFTFIFANCIDDINMQISHVFRGEDHLSNTVMQILLYKSFNARLPIFWHLPIICNLDGTKLSKRDFGFSLDDLRKAGFLHQAIINYLTLIGNSFAQEILDLDQLIKLYDFSNVHSAGTVKYDVKKLEWVNQQWIQKITTLELAELLKPFIISNYPDAINFDLNWWQAVAELVKTDIVMLKDAAKLIEFIFKKPELILTKELDNIIIKSIKNNDDKINSLVIPELDFNVLRELIINKSLAELISKPVPANINKKYFYQLLRIIITGSTHGAQMHLLANIYHQALII